MSSIKIIQRGSEHFSGKRYFQRIITYHIKIAPDCVWSNMKLLNLGSSNKDNHTVNIVVEILFESIRFAKLERILENF